MITLDYGGINDSPYPLNCWDILRAFSLQHKDERYLNANVKKKRIRQSAAKLRIGERSSTNVDKRSQRRITKVKI